MKPNWNIKNIIIGFILLLVACDVSLLFAAQTNTATPDFNNISNNNPSAQQQLQQIQDLQQQRSSAPQPVYAQNDQNPVTGNGQNSQVNSQNNQGGANSPGSVMPPGAMSSFNPPPSQTVNSAPVSTAPTFANNQANNPQPPPPASFPQQTGVAPQPNGQSNGSYNSINRPIGPPSLGSLPIPPTSSPTPTPSASGDVPLQNVNSAAFGAVTQNLLPMTPEQIQRLRQLFDQSQYAASALPNTPPRPVIGSQFVNLAPGSTPSVIRLQQGMVTVLTFIDSTGAPWPIAAYDIGNPTAFNIQWNKTDNTMMIQPLTTYTYGNLAVVLQGLATPIMLTLTTGQQAFDARMDLHIQGLGPNATAIPTGSGLPNSADPDLLGVLDGVPPAGSTILPISGGYAQAWLSNGKMFVRTRYTILSPGWLSTMSSADGMHAYLLPTAPMLLATQNGKIVQMKVGGL